MAKFNGFPERMKEHDVVNMWQENGVTSRRPLRRVVLLVLHTFDDSQWW